MVAFAGLCVAGHLTLYQIGVLEDPFFQSPEVLHLLGFPDASLGVLAYGTENLLSFIGGRDRKQPGRRVTTGPANLPGGDTSKSFGGGWKALLSGQR